MKRGVGIAGLQKHNQSKSKFKEAGTSLSSIEADKMKEQLQIFKENLEQFARKHKKDINENPSFRRHFQQMCQSIGVDPLASNRGFWAEILGVGDFYAELSVQMMDICISTRSTNGGLIEINDMRRMLQQIRTQKISLDDVERAATHLEALGSGFGILYLGNRKMIRSVPVELNKDHLTLLNIAQTQGYVTHAQAKKELEWDDPRITSALLLLLKEGFAWLDTQGPEKRFYIPCLSTQLEISEIAQ